MALPNAYATLGISQINVELGRASNAANSTLRQLAGLARVGTTPYNNRLGQTQISDWYGYTNVPPFATVGSGPRAMCLDTSGNLYVANYTAGTVSKVTPAGVVTAVWATVGTNPIAICSDNNYIYVANYGSNNITRITIAGVVVSTGFGGTFTAASGVVADTSFNVYVTTLSTNRVYKVQNSGVSAQFSTTGPNPSKIVRASDGTFYVLCQGSNEISKITSAGVYSVLGYYQGGGAMGMNIDKTNNDCYVYTMSQLNKITSAGVVSKVCDIYITQLVNNNGICIDSAHNVYLTDKFSSYITKVEGGAPSTLLNPAESQPVDVIVDSSNTYIYVANFASNTISKILK